MTYLGAQLYRDRFDCDPTFARLPEEGFLPDGPVVIGITSGASTPDSVVGECLQRILAIRGLPGEDNYTSGSDEAVAVRNTIMRQARLCALVNRWFYYSCSFGGIHSMISTSSKPLLCQIMELLTAGFCHRYRFVVPLMRNMLISWDGFVPESQSPPNKHVPDTFVTFEQGRSSRRRQTCERVILSDRDEFALSDFYLYVLLYLET